MTSGWLEGPIVVFDMEWTTWEGAEARRWSGPGEHMEIVQIGAVRLDDGQELLETGSFEILVRPAFNPVLSDYFIGLTGIPQARVDAEGVDFPAALAAFAGFLGADIGIVCSFGGDVMVLEENCRFNGLAFPFAADLFRDVRPEIREVLDMEEKHLVSGNLPRLFGFPPPGTAHQAITDARCTAEALRILTARHRMKW